MQRVLLAQEQVAKVAVVLVLEPLPPLQELARVLLVTWQMSRPSL